MKHVFDIGKDAPQFVAFEEQQNEISNEVMYLVEVPGFEPFLMAYDNDRGRLAAVAEVPDAVKALEETIYAGIDAYNNGFFWL